MSVHRCLLTGAANTLANCTAQIQDFVGTSTNDAWCPQHPTLGVRDCSMSKFPVQLGDLYNADGSPNQLEVAPTFSALDSAIQFYGLTTNTNYYIRPSPRAIGSGWVMITGGIALVFRGGFDRAGVPPGWRTSPVSRSFCQLDKSKE